MRIDVLHQRMLVYARPLFNDLQCAWEQRLPDAYRTQQVNVASFVKRLNRVTYTHRIRNVVKPPINKKTHPEGHLRFSAEWSPPEVCAQEGTIEDIFIYWHVHPRTRRYTFTSARWEYLRFSYSMYLIHELLHRCQSEARDPHIEERVYRPHAQEEPLRNDQSYLGEHKEIEAYAHDIALELLAAFPDLSWRHALHELETMRAPYAQSGVTGFTSYLMYQTTFQQTKKHPAMTVLHRKIAAWHAYLKQCPDEYYAFGLLPLRTRARQLAFQIL